jgi:hypothetical protein
MTKEQTTLLCTRMESLAGHNQVLKGLPGIEYRSRANLRADLDEALILGALSNVGDYQVLRASPARRRDPEADMSVDLSENPDLRVFEQRRALSDAGGLPSTEYRPRAWVSS